MKIITEPIEMNIQRFKEMVVNQFKSLGTKVLTINLYTLDEQYVFKILLDIPADKYTTLVVPEIINYLCNKLIIEVRTGELVIIRVSVKQAVLIQ